eukprot:SAG22_NODE_74_length_22289_cov_65.265119_13_plen_432_part_00
MPTLDQAQKCIALLDTMGEEHKGRKYCVKIEKANEPETYMYGNLQYSPFTRQLYRMLVSLLILLVLAVCVFFVVVAYAFQGRTGYVDNCFDVIQNQPDVCAAPSSASLLWYALAFQDSKTAMGLDYPTIGNSVNSNCQECKAPSFDCCPVYQYDEVLRDADPYAVQDYDTSSTATAACTASWDNATGAGRLDGPPGSLGPWVPTWESAEALACHRVDKDGLLAKNADLEGVCYACVCTVVTKLSSLAIAIDRDGHALYLDTEVPADSFLAGVLTAEPGTLDADVVGCAGGGRGGGGGGATNSTCTKQYREVGVLEILRAYRGSLEGLKFWADEVAAVGGFDPSWSIVELAEADGEMRCNGYPYSCRAITQLYGPEFTNVDASVLASAGDANTADSGPYCAAWVDEEAKSSIYGYLAMFAVSVFNLILKCKG